MSQRHRLENECIELEIKELQQFNSGLVGYRTSFNVLARTEKVSQVTKPLPIRSPVRKVAVMHQKAVCQPP